MLSTHILVNASEATYITSGALNDSKTLYAYAKLRARLPYIYELLGTSLETYYLPTSKQYGSYEYFIISCIND